MWGLLARRAVCRRGAARQRVGSVGGSLESGSSTLEGSDASASVKRMRMVRGRRGRPVSSHSVYRCSSQTRSEGQSGPGRGDCEHDQRCHHHRRRFRGANAMTSVGWSGGVHTRLSMTVGPLVSTVSSRIRAAGGRASGRFDRAAERSRAARRVGRRDLDRRAGSSMPAWLGRRHQTAAGRWPRTNNGAQPHTSVADVTGPPRDGSGVIQAGRADHHPAAGH